MTGIGNASLVYVDSLDKLDGFRQWLGNRRDWLAVDCETEGLNVARDHVRMVQFGDLEMGWCLPYRDWRGAVAEILPRYRGNIVAHNLLFDSKMLKWDGIEIPQRWAHDTMVMAKMIDPVRGAHLKGLGVRYVDRRAAAGQDDLKKVMALTGWDWATVPLDHPAYWIYSALDTVLTAHLAEKLWTPMQPWRENYELELGVIHILRDAELRGLRVDVPYLERVKAQLEWKLNELGPQIPFDALSPDQLVRYLQENGANLTLRTERGNLSTDDEVLRSLEQRIPVAGLVREYRTAAKLYSSYAKKILDLQEGGFLHHSTHPLEARTGRMSVRDPSLQNLPRGRVIRDTFVAREGRRLLIADFEQQELRVMAHFANEEAMLAAFERGEDMHTWVASEVYEKEIAAVQPGERGLAKNTQFCLIYGGGAPKIAMTAGVRVDIAEAFLTKYTQLFPGVRRWMDNSIGEVRGTQRGKEWGYVTTRFGRRLPVEPDKAYKGANYKIQGSCAEVTKRQLVSCANAGLGDYFLLPVHDEYLFDVPTEDLEEAKHTVEEAMPDRDSFRVPLTIDYGDYSRWGEKYGGDPVVPLTV